MIDWQTVFASALAVSVGIILLVILEYGKGRDGGW
jgi:hypothetical protein